MTRYLTRDRAAITAAVIAPVAAAAILLPFRSSWPNTNVALLLVVVVVAVAAIGNRVAGVIAAAGAAVWFDFFFTLPYERFTIRSSADVTTFALLLVVGVAVSQLAAYARRLKVVAITDTGYLAQIHRTASLTQTAKSSDEVVDHVREQLTGLLDLRDCRFEYGVLVGHPPRLEPDGTVIGGRGRSDVEDVGLPDEEVRAARVRQRPFLRAVHDEAQAGVQAVPAGAPGRRHAGRSDRTRAFGRHAVLERALTKWAERCLASVA
jgi:hypothetical protein